MQESLVAGKEPQKSDDAARTRNKRWDRIRRFCAYFLIKWTLQILCALVVVAAVVWATIQFMRISNLLGVSQEPPGLCADGARTQAFLPRPSAVPIHHAPAYRAHRVYFVPGLAPDPPPPPSLLLGR